MFRSTEAIETEVVTQGRVETPYSHGRNRLGSYRLVAAVGIAAVVLAPFLAPRIASAGSPTEQSAERIEAGFQVHDPHAGNGPLTEGEHLAINLDGKGSYSRIIPGQYTMITELNKDGRNASIIPAFGAPNHMFYGIRFDGTLGNIFVGTTPSLEVKAGTSYLVEAYEGEYYKDARKIPNLGAAFLATEVTTPENQEVFKDSDSQEEYFQCGGNNGTRFYRNETTVRVIKATKGDKAAFFTQTLGDKSGECGNSPK